VPRMKRVDDGEELFCLSRIGCSSQPTPNPTLKRWAIIRRPSGTDTKS
jgi:hypothetical protein